jgi:hypothetical protein
VVGCGNTTTTTVTVAARASGITSSAATTAPATTPTSATPTLAARIETVRKPHIIWDPIPFGAQRKAQMVAYVRRHYGSFMKPTYKLLDPHVVVIHYTETPTYQATYNTFAPDTPDPELHELPNTCAHFVIDKAGGIHQLVPLNVMCRHTVGLNWTAVGIEHVGFSDQEVLDDSAQMAASPQAGALAALPLPHRDQERDRSQREPLQPVPPRGRARAAHADALRLQPCRHAGLPSPPRRRGRLPSVRRCRLTPCTEAAAALIAWVRGVNSHAPTLALLRGDDPHAPPMLDATPMALGDSPRCKAQQPVSLHARRATATEDVDLLGPNPACWVAGIDLWHRCLRAAPMWPSRRKRFGRRRAGCRHEATAKRGRGYEAHSSR